MVYNDYYLVRSTKLQDWLWEHGRQPDRVSGNGYYYLYDLSFEALLGDYFIETVIF